MLSIRVRPVRDDLFTKGCNSKSNDSALRSTQGNLFYPDLPGVVPVPRVVEC
jgi:hypothetical protein